MTDVATIAARLHADLTATEARLRALGAPVVTDVHAGGSELDVDAASSAQAQLEHFGDVERLRLHRRALLLAIERAQAGTLDVCVLCEGPIGAKRLEAIPTADTCIACQRDREARARRALAGRGFDQEAC
jgi:RNA polymerase-binding transcription factor DksA